MNGADGSKFGPQPFDLRSVGHQIGQNVKRLDGGGQKGQRDPIRIRIQPMRVKIEEKMQTTHQIQAVVVRQKKI